MFMNLLLLAGGIFCLWAAYTRQEWFLKSNRAWLFLKLFGKEGARIAYIVLGIFIILISLFLMCLGV